MILSSLGLQAADSTVSPILNLVINSTSHCAFQMIFDPTMSKKKKKKKKPFMLEEEGGDATNEDAQQPEVKEVEADGGEDREMDLDEDEGRKKGRKEVGAPINTVMDPVSYYY